MDIPIKPLVSALPFSLSFLGLTILYPQSPEKQAGKIILRRFSKEQGLNKFPCPVGEGQRRAGQVPKQKYQP